MSNLGLAHLTVPHAPGNLFEPETGQVGDLIVTVVADEQFVVAPFITTDVTSVSELRNLTFFNICLRFRLYPCFLRNDQLLTNLALSNSVCMQREAGYFAQGTTVSHLCPFRDALKAKVVLAFVHFGSFLCLLQAYHASHGLNCLQRLLRIIIFIL